MTRRRGFTLWEMTIVLALVALSAAVVIPSWVDFGETPSVAPGDALVALLRDARRVAIDESQIVGVQIDPSTLYYRVDTTGANGTGLYADGTLEMSTYESLDTDLKRLRYTFRPTGAALGDTVAVRGGDYPVTVALDPWSGYAGAYAR
jgi:prepilin-type N-terminal cleavage/methylation domain-containing protein